MRRILLAIAGFAGATVGGVFAQEVEITELGLERGKQLYQVHCARCHGMLGFGGEGPNLARPTLPRAPDHSSLVQVIRRGIPGTGMPGAWPTVLPDLETDLVAAYVLSLGEGAIVEVYGDAERGRNLFATAGDCYSCHIVNGRGTGVGPELTNIGLTRGVEHFYASLKTPESELPTTRRGVPSGFAQYLPVRAVTREGRVLNGMRVNEDAFTIRLRTVSGRLISLRKSDLAELEKRFTHSFMPAADDMTEEDLDDLIAYLVSLGAGS